MTERLAQPVRWGDYEPYQPGGGRSLHELSGTEARAIYEQTMLSIPDRVRQLRSLLEANDVDADDLRAVYDWFVGSVQESPDVGTRRLADIWYSVVNDIGIMLGERAIAATNGGLRWHLIEGPKNDVSYHRHVIMGFDVPNPDYNADFSGVLQMHGLRIIRGEQAPPDFLTVLFAASLEKAPAGPKAE